MATKDVPIKCGCGNIFFTKKVKLIKKSCGSLIEEVYYVCSECRSGVSKDNLIYEIKNDLIRDAIYIDHDF
jgi:hypothetical protein